LVQERGKEFSGMSDQPKSSPGDEAEEGRPEVGLREIQFRHSEHFVPLLQHLRCSLLVSTYAANKLAVVGSKDNSLQLAFSNFDQCMGVAVHPKKLAVGTRRQIWFLNNDSQLAAGMEPVGQYDGCFLPASSMFTSRIQGHELAWCGDELWVVNTLFSCLCTLHDEFNFVPRWRPPFISELSGNDRCHLNGLAIDAGRPKYVTAMSESNEPAGWRPTKTESGCLIAVESGETVARGFAMPHSPRCYQEKVWVLDSGRGELGTVDPADGKYETVESMPGYTRGLAFFGDYAFVGLSQIRETAVFGGVPIAERREDLKCGVGIVDLRSGQSVASLEFSTGIQEIFAIAILPQILNPTVVEPIPVDEKAHDIWVVPREEQVKKLVKGQQIPAR
jgi:uncharacterized protein (TIGR03032 family)